MRLQGYPTPGLESKKKPRQSQARFPRFVCAVEYVPSNVKFLFQEAEIPDTAMFDVRLKAGTIIILINSRHPAREHFFDLVKQEGAEVDTPAQKALKLLLSAWARLEDEAAGSGRKQFLEDARADWGRLARDFLQAANE